MKFKSSLLNCSYIASIFEFFFELMNSFYWSSDFEKICYRSRKDERSNLKSEGIWAKDGSKRIGQLPTRSWFIALHNSCGTHIPRPLRPRWIPFYFRYFLFTEIVPSAFFHLKAPDSNFNMRWKSHFSIIWSKLWELLKCCWNIQCNRLPLGNEIRPWICMVLLFTVAFSDITSINNLRSCSLWGSYALPLENSRLETKKTLSGIT